MEITDIKFRQMHEDGRLRALVSVTLDDILAVHDIKIIQGNSRLFLAMPSKRMPDGQYRDIVHPVGSAMREKLEKIVLSAYATEEKENLPS
jgi:stage V sporulation protein G